MREPRGEGGETGKGKLVGESFIHEVGTSVTNMHSFITRIFYLYLGVHLCFDDEMLWC